MSDGWHADPLGRYSQRYFDGSGWTAHVSNGATPEIDPLGVDPSPAQAATVQTFVPPPPHAVGAYGAALADGNGLPPGVEYASPWLRLASYLVDGFLMSITLVIGWLIWALTTAGTGQTPGKKLLGMRVISANDRRPVGLGTMFWMRGVIAAIVAAIVVTVTFGIIVFMPFWDRRNQNIWDKVSSTYVVTDPNDAWAMRG